MSKHSASEGVFTITPGREWTLVFEGVEARFVDIGGAGEFAWVSVELRKAEED
jgi:hypothetical protein